MSSNSRLDDAHRALDLLREIQGQRLVPEFRMHAAKLCALINDTRGQFHLDNLARWFASEKLSYQSDLLSLQSLIIATPGIANIFIEDEGDALTQIEQLPDQAREIMLSARRNRTAVPDNYYAAAHTMSTHHNHYWHARGLAAALIIGKAADRERSWVDRVRTELNDAATIIGRTDWIDKVDGYGDTSIGLWLFGY